MSNSEENHENGLFQGLENHSSDSEIDSIDLENNPDDEESLCVFCDHPNPLKSSKLYEGVRFCDKFCANRFHLKQKASLEEIVPEPHPNAVNKPAKKKGVGQRKSKGQGKYRQRGGEKQKPPKERRILKPKLKTASKGTIFY